MPSDTDSAILTPPPAEPLAVSIAPADGSVIEADEVVTDTSDQVTQAEIDNHREKSEKQEADVLAKLLGKDSPAKAKAKAEFVPEIDGDEDDSPEPTKAKAQPADKAPASSADDEANRLAFMRAQFTPQEAADYREKYGDKAFIAKAAAFRKQQADTDRAFALAKGQPIPSHLMPTLPGAEAPGKDSSEALPDDSDIDRLLNESFDDVAATKLRAKLNGTNEQLQRAAQAELAANQRLVSTLFKSTRITLAKELPGFSDPAKEPRIREMMKMLDPRAEAIESPEAFEQVAKQAYYAAFGNEIAADARAKLIAENRAVRAGQLTAGHRSSTRATGNADDFDAAMLKVIKRTSGDADRQAKEVGKLKSYYGKQ